MSFPNQAVSGDQLVADAIESQDYVTGVTGWRISRDGSAEFAGFKFEPIPGPAMKITAPNGDIIMGEADGIKINSDAGIGLNAASLIEIEVDGDHGGQFITIMNDGSGPALINGNGNGKLHWTNSGTFIDGLSGTGVLTNRIVVASASGGTSYLRAFNADGSIATGIDVATSGLTLRTGTTSSAANVFMNTNGVVSRSTSATKYKTDIQPADFGTAVLDLVPKTWIDRAELAQADNDPSGLNRYPGLIAEDVHSAGLDEFVTTNEDGEIDGLMYDRIAVALIPLLKDARDRIAVLEHQLKEG